MTSRFLCGLLSALLVAFVLAASGQSSATELREMRVRLPAHLQSWGNGLILSRERHVLERRPSDDGTFLINGTWYSAEAGQCRHWVAGDRIKLRAGDWHGGPVVFRNVRRGRTCGFQGP